MNVMPIPKPLLKDKITLAVPTAAGYVNTEVTCVRVAEKSAVREHSATDIREVSEITVYYDCVNSLPQKLGFTAGMTLIYGGRRYEIISAEKFRAAALHHIRIKARIVE